MATLLTPGDVDDLVALILPKFKKNAWENLTTDYPEYASSRLLKRENVTVAGGRAINWKLKVNETGTARNSGLYDADETNIEDLATSAEAPWTKQTGNYSYDADELLMSSDDTEIVSVLKMREVGCKEEMVELNELNMWSEPSTSAEKRPWGVPYYLRKATVASGGTFAGGNPDSSFGGCAGVDTDTYPAWKNFNFTYTAVTTDDLIKKVKKSLRNTRFVAPVPHPELGMGKAKCEMWTVESVVDTLERVAESRNDSLGSDVARYMGQVTIGGCPVRISWHLDQTDSTNPMYGINWSQFKPNVLRGANMRRTLKKGARQHTVSEVHYDTWMNYTCWNRRRAGFVGHVL